MPNTFRHNSIMEHFLDSGRHDILFIPETTYQMVTAGHQVKHLSGAQYNLHLMGYTIEYDSPMHVWLSLQGCQTRSIGPYHILELDQSHQSH